MAPSQSHQLTLFGDAPLNAPARDLGDFRLETDTAPSNNWRERAAQNLAALALSQAISGRNTPATQTERETLFRFSGFGASALANGMFRDPRGNLRTGWEDLAKELERTVDATGLAALQKATQYAHYTPIPIARAMWDAISSLGFIGGDILEPGCGTGVFFAVTPPRIAARSRFLGIDDDPNSIGICRHLYPSGQFLIEDFCATTNTHAADLVIANPPYSDRTVRNLTPIGRLGLSLHDHFLVRSLSGLRPGGYAAFLISRYFMDKADSNARALVDQTCDLIAAVRLPNGCMRSAGTDVTADVLLFQRRQPSEPKPTSSWLAVSEILPATATEPSIAINEYWLRQPRAVLGNHCRVSSQFGPIYGCRTDNPADTAKQLSAQLSSAVATYRLTHQPTPSVAPHLPGLSEPNSSATLHPRGTRHAATQPATQRPIPITQLASQKGAPHWRNGSYLVHQGALMQVSNGYAHRIEQRRQGAPNGLPATHSKLIRLMIPIRDAIRAVLDAQRTGEPWTSAQKTLRAAYEAFTAKTGHPLNHTVHYERTDPTTGDTKEYLRHPALNAFKADPDCWLIASIETYDALSNTALPGPIFTDRILGPAPTTSVNDAIDALPVTLRDRGMVDLPYLAQMAGVAVDEAIATLGERIYENPADMTWETADAYLSGPVRKKLRYAREAALLNPRFARNVEALEAAQPALVPPSQITVNLGTPWIPTTDIASFCEEILGVTTTITHSPAIAAWDITHGDFSGPICNATYGSARINARDLLEQALNGKTPTIRDTIIEDGKETSVINLTETEVARAKQEELKAAFSSWIWKDAQRTERLVEAYNETYNNLRLRSFDGSHLTLDDSSLQLKFHPHQRRAIWRIITAGSTYIAHHMGAGKTMEIIAAVMEQRRIGLVKKPLITCPNHVLAQFAAEFLRVYPTARILVANEEDMARPNRLQFMARATTEDWDAVILSHSAFGFLPLPPDFEAKIHEEQRDMFIEAIASIADKNSLTRKRLERAKEAINQKIANLRKARDNMVTLADMGIDQIIVDEAHEYRKLTYATNRKNVKGIDPDGSKRAWHLFLASRYTTSINPGRGLILSSGTPISNTLAELFTIQRFMAPETLIERNIHMFDAWAATFGAMKSEIERQPGGGYKRVDRFAEFINLPELTAMFREYADVLLADDLKNYVTLPSLHTGTRQIVTAPATPNFILGQERLAERIAKIAQRTGGPIKGEDIILSVITDGRLLSVDPRTLDPLAPNEPDAKLNTLIDRAFSIYERNLDKVYTDPFTGAPMPLKGAAQMIFSDIAIKASERRGSFSAYEWIRAELIRRGVPPQKVAFMQDYKTAAARRTVFQMVNRGEVLFLIGSSATMGTGANAQLRLIALHHLDQPWLVAHLEQRECRMVRQGNQNPEVELIAYVTKGSMDATLWQFLKRKAQFINAILKADPTIRRMEDDDEQVNSFAFARAMASGDERLIRKAGLEADISRLQRLRKAHTDSTFSARIAVGNISQRIAHLEREIPLAAKDAQLVRDTKDNDFQMEIGRRSYAKRAEAAAALEEVRRNATLQRTVGTWHLGTISGFPIEAHGTTRSIGLGQLYEFNLNLVLNAGTREIILNPEAGAIGAINRLENAIERLAALPETLRATLERERRHLPGYQLSAEAAFEFEHDLDTLLAENAALDADLAGSTTDGTPTADNDDRPLALAS